MVDFFIFLFFFKDPNQWQIVGGRPHFEFHPAFRFEEAYLGAEEVELNRWGAHHIDPFFRKKTNIDPSFDGFRHIPIPVTLG